MPKGWSVCELGDCLSKILDYRGKTPKKVGGNWGKSGFRAISAKNIKNGRLVSLRSIRFVDEVIYKKWMKVEVEKEDILLTSEAPLGEVLLWNSAEKIVLSQRVFGIRADRKKVYPKYLNAYMHSFLFQHELLSRATGSTVQGIRQSELIKTRVLLPSMREQIAIGDFYTSIAEKIELNHKISETLESMANSTFRSWFVGYNFPGHENANSSGGIPDGWGLKPIGEIADFVRGFSYKGSEKYDTPNDYAFITLNNVKESGGFKSVYAWISSGRLKERHFLNEYDLIIANTEQTRDGTLLAFPAIVYFPRGYQKNNAVFSHHITKIISKNPELKFYLYFHLLYAQNESLGFHTGSVIWSLDVENFAKNKEVYVPPIEILKSFNDLVEPIFVNLAENQKQTDCLSQIRDSLLPKLLSGEVRVG